MLLTFFQIYILLIKLTSLFFFRPFHKEYLTLVLEEGKVKHNIWAKHLVTIVYFTYKNKIKIQNSNYFFGVLTFSLSLSLSIFDFTFTNAQLEFQQTLFLRF